MPNNTRNLMLRYLVRSSKGVIAQLANRAKAISLARENKGYVLDLLETYRPDSLSQKMIADFTDRH